MITEAEKSYRAFAQRQQGLPVDQVLSRLNDYRAYLRLPPERALQIEEQAGFYRSNGLTINFIGCNVHIGSINK